VRLNAIQVTALIGLGYFGFNTDLFVRAVIAQPQPQESKGIAVSALKCERKSTGVTCSLLVTDKRQEMSERRCYFVNRGTRAFDGAGTEYIPNVIQFGGKEVTSAGVDLVYGVPIRVSAHFPAVSSNVVKFVGFSMEPLCTGSSGSSFVFRNIAIIPTSN
jgi:hypothetical protein